jgi:hypothetical protein
LTDTFCQIEKCWLYAAKTDRNLIIDATRSGLWGHFTDFFSINQTELTVNGCPIPGLVEKLNTMSCYPHPLRGRLARYECRWDTSLRALVDAETGTHLSFDFDADYGEQVLVHHQAGGGAHLAFNLLRRVTLECGVASEFRTRLRAIGSGYDAIHIRNSDYKTPWEPFLSAVVDRLTSDKVLVCSDDIRVIRFCQAFFSPKTFLTSSMPPYTDGKALHTHEFSMSAEQRRLVVRDGLLDLLALAGGDSLWYPQTTQGHASGYSELARHLHENRWVVSSLLSLEQ